MDPDRRQHPRFKVRVPVEFFSDGSDSPIRGATSDLSLSGCYIETVFPFAIGTRLELKLQIDGTLLVLATVATSDPQVGTGMNSPACSQRTSTNSAPSSTPPRSRNSAGVRRFVRKDGQPWRVSLDARVERKRFPHKTHSITSNSRLFAVSF
jgi:hypothetical protein